MLEAPTPAPSPVPAPAPVTPLPRPIDPRRVELLGLATLALIAAIIPLYLWQRWGPGDGPLRALAQRHFYPLAALLFVTGDIVGVYTIVRAVEYLRRPTAPLELRLRAGYGLSYAVFPLLAAFVVIAWNLRPG